MTDQERDARLRGMLEAVEDACEPGEAAVLFVFNDDGVAAALSRLEMREVVMLVARWVGNRLIELSAQWRERSTRLDA